MHLRFIGSPNFYLKKTFRAVPGLFIFMISLLFTIACSSSVPAGKEIHPANVRVNDYWSTDGAYELLRLMKGDVEDFYNIKSKYPSDLELKVFRKSGEPERLKNEMKKKLAFLLGKTYAMEIDRIDLYDYDLKKKAFRLYVDNFIIGGEGGRPKTESHMLKGFWFDELPFRFETDHLDDVFGEYGHYRRLYLRVDEDLAMKLGKTNNAVYLIFNVEKALALKNGFIRAKNVGLIVVDKSDWSTLYAVKFSNFDEKKVWVKK